MKIKGDFAALIIFLLKDRLSRDIIATL